MKSRKLPGALPRRPLRTGAVCLAAIAGLAGLAQAQELASVVRDYEARLLRPSLWKRTQARMRLASMGVPEARDRLIQDFGTVEEPLEFVRASLIELIVDAYDLERDLTALATWREQYQKPEDAWLWFRTLRAEGYYDNRSNLTRLGADTEIDVALRAAALHAIAGSARSMRIDMTAIEMAEATLGSLPRKKGRERTLLLEAAASVIDAQRYSMKYPRYKALVVALARLLDDRLTEDRSRIVISRHLARILDQGNLGISSRPWLAALDVDAEETKGRTKKVPVTRFFGVDAVGSRVVFVIDASDSMLSPLTDGERDRMIPITGQASTNLPDDTTRKLIERELPWDKIHNRYHAAVGFLELALRELGKKQQFAVVLFGDDARLLPGTKGLQKATPRNIERAVKALWALEVGPPSEERPHGRLLGRTNLHAGMALAYRVTDKKLGERADLADARALIGGADTFFVLSDGDPTWDDFAASDMADFDDRAGDPESGAVASRVPGKLLFPGPFAQRRFLVAEIRRFNLLRRAQLHAIGFGDASSDLLHEIAEVGLGESLMLGK